MFRRKKTILSFVLISAFTLSASKAEVVSKSTVWADSVMQTMNLKQKIAQLFMVAAYSNKPDTHVQEIYQLVQQYGVGGLCFFQGSPKKQAELTNFYQQGANIPLLISMDAEWGVGMRLDSVLLFPKQMALGSIRNPNLIYELGRQVGKQFKALGMHLNFAPVVDVNNNPLNPVINTRSFGEDRKEVAERSILYMKGMQAEGIITCAKHFPGHGDTQVDSHFDLPILDYSKKRLDSLELFPFRKIIKAGVNSVMVGHLYVPAIEAEKGIPASLSSKVIQDLLQKELHFKGIVFSDGMQMKAISNNFPAPIANLKALQAGCDMLVFPTQVIASIDTIEAAVLRNEFSLEQLNAKCKKILVAKYDLQLTHFSAIPSDKVTAFLNRPEAKALQAQLIEESFILLKNNHQTLPLNNPDLSSCVYLEIGKDQGTVFYNRIKDYANIPRISTVQRIDSLNAKLTDLRKFKTVIVAYHDLSEYPQRNFRIDTAFAKQIIDSLPNQTKILVLFGTPYTLTKLPKPDFFASVLVCHNNQTLTQDKAAQAIMGGIGIQGKQPVGKSIYEAHGKHLNTEISRMSYVEPYELGILEEDLSDIDSLVQIGLDQKAFPGCQILAAYDGKVFFQKAYGTLSYTDSSRTNLHTMYDVASMSKVTGTLGVVMHLFDTKAIHLNDPLKMYLNHLPDSKKGLTIKELLAHQAGLIAFEPYYSRFLLQPNPDSPLYASESSSSYPVQIGKRWANKEAQMNPMFFRPEYSKDYPHQVGKDVFEHISVRDSVYKYMDQSKEQPKIYRYSDLSFLYLQRVLEAKTGTALDHWCDSLYFSPLQMYRTCYTPAQKMEVDSIAPTSYDPLFRKQILRGYVDDNNAAMLGGVAGHAGLFSTCNDLSKYYQMLMWHGTYGGEEFLSKKTIKLFTSQAYKHSDNRRALGFDRPEPHKGKDNPGPSELSQSGFGHTGFTGCMVWCDPARKLVYVFLSNRVNPDPSNGLLSKLSTRSEILKRFVTILDQKQKNE